MAIHTVITPLAANEAPRETIASSAFSALLQAQSAFVRAERDLEDIGHSQDPAYDFWLRDAELAQEVLTRALHHFHALPLEVPEDRPLRRMALLIDAMLGNEEPGDARCLHRKMQLAFFAQFQAQGIGATAMHRNSLLIQARHLTSAMVALPLFDGTDVSDPDAEPGMAVGLF
ncbi:MAG TPA: hypothetical protein PKY73_00305 [Hyphomonas sp.]|nr:hypothetical protein [Hyphomonas sp.]